MKNYINLAVAISVSLFSLTGCGGSSDTVVSTQNTGYFIDSQVRGLDYETSSGKVGKTNSLGQFFYEPDDVVSFSVGGVQLGQALPDIDGLITPKHLSDEAEGSDPVRAAELEILLLRFLQSLDVDDDPSNGITINPLLLEALHNLDDVSIADLTEATLLDLDADLRDELDEDGDGAIDVTEDDALAHADESIVEWENGDKPTHPNGLGNGNQNEDPIAETISDLTVDQKYSLAYMWNEERLAKDIYLALNDIYPSTQFENIATKSEVKHIDAVEGLVEKYDINILNLVDYTVNYSEEELRALPAGTYAIDSIQSLYDDLYVKGELSKVDALQVGCMVEVTDVNDLNTFITVAEEVDAVDLILVYEKLRAGSYNHYWAFDKALKTEGVLDGCASLGVEYAKTQDEYPTSQGNGSAQN